MTEAKKDQLENDMDKILNERVMETYEEKKKSKAGGFKRLKPKAKTPDNKLKGSFSIFKEKPKKVASSPVPIPVAESEVAGSVREEEMSVVPDVEEGEEERAEGVEGEVTYCTGLGFESL